MKMKILLPIILSVLFTQLFSPPAFSQPDPSSALNHLDDNGRKQGFWAKKNPEGTLVYEGQFRDDIPYGEFRYYYPDGKLRTTMLYAEGGQPASTISFHPTGLKMAEGNYINKLKDGTWTYYNDSGQHASIEHYSNGIPMGIWKVFSGDTNVIEETTYKSGKKEGPWKQYFPNGSLLSEGVFINGQLEGEAKFYYPEGALMAKGNYLNGLKNGIWTNYKESGEVESIFDYLKGEVLNETYLDKAKEKEFMEAEPELKKD